MAEGMESALGAMMFYGLADWVFKRAAASGVLFISTVEALIDHPLSVSLTEPLK
jgi:hypothetical protein